MTVLVTAASRHGATYEIAEAIGRALAERGIDVQVAAVEDVNAVAVFEAVVVGSGVYAGRSGCESPRVPRRGAFRRAGPHPDMALQQRPDRLAAAARRRPAVDVTELVAAAGPRGHRVFAGRLDRHRLGFGERAMVFAFRAEDGDFRDWDAIATWAGGIADELQA